MRIAPAVARGLRLSVIEGSLFAVYYNVVAGVIINGLALAAGARPIHLAILNALRIGAITRLSDSVTALLTSTDGEYRKLQRT